jgi:predicted GTPase
MADVVVINKVDTADLTATEALRDHVRAANTDARIVEAASPVIAEGAERITGRRVLVVEDGPTLTHGDMRFGAGTVLARKFGAAEIIDPRPFAVGSIADTYNTYPAIGRLLPAMGYGDAQIRELEATITQVPCDFVIVGTPIDLSRLVKIDKPVVRARYELQEVARPDLADALAPLLKQITSAPRVPAAG